MSSSRVNDEKYLDFVEFCLAEFCLDTDSTDGSDSNSTTAHGHHNIDSRSSQTNEINRRRLPRNRVVDYELLNRFKQDYSEIHSVFQESLLLLRISVIHKYTVHLPLLNTYSSGGANGTRLMHLQKKLLVDMRTFYTFTRSNELNWIPQLNNLYPIKTIGDGNCLCHAALSYITGMQDLNLALRETLKSFMNSADIVQKIKSRWILHRRAADLANSIQVDEKELNVEWSEIINMKVPESNKMTTSGENGKPAAPLGSDIITAANISVGGMSPLSASLSSSSSQTPLVYLEDIHIFGLANFLRRAIIVISLETIRNIQPIHLRGIYLPLLVQPAECIRDPIVMAFHNFHFMPLVFALDDVAQICDSANGDFVYSDAFRCFESTEVSNAANRDDDYGGDETDLMSRSRRIKTKLRVLYNYLPLVYANRSRMKIHFLATDEESHYDRLLAAYLRLVDIRVGADEWSSSTLSSSSSSSTTILCCRLLRDSKIFKKNGISTFLDFTNASHRQVEGANDEAVIVPADIALSSLSPPSSTRFAADMFDYGENRPFCKTIHCTQRALDNPSKHHGYCFNCYRSVVLANNSIAKSDFVVKPNSPRPVRYVDLAPRTSRHQPEIVPTSPPSPPPYFLNDREVLQQQWQQQQQQQLKRCSAFNCKRMAGTASEFCNQCKRDMLVTSHDMATRHQLNKNTEFDRIGNNNSYHDMTASNVLKSATNTSTCGGESATSSVAESGRRGISIPITFVNKNDNLSGGGYVNRLPSKAISNNLRPQVDSTTPYSRETTYNENRIPMITKTSAFDTRLNNEQPLRDHMAERSPYFKVDRSKLTDLQICVVCKAQFKPSLARPNQNACQLCVRQFDIF